MNLHITPQIPMTTFEPNIKIKKCDIHVLVKLDFWLTREIILSVR